MVNLRILSQKNGSGAMGKGKKKTSDRLESGHSLGVPDGSESVSTSDGELFDPRRSATSKLGKNSKNPTDASRSSHKDSRGTSDFPFGNDIPLMDGLLQNNRVAHALSLTLGREAEIWTVNGFYINGLIYALGPSGEVILRDAVMERIDDAGEKTTESHEYLCLKKDDFVDMQVRNTFASACAASAADQQNGTHVPSDHIEDASFVSEMDSVLTASIENVLDEGKVPSSVVAASATPQGAILSHETSKEDDQVVPDVDKSQNDRSVPQARPFYPNNRRYPSGNKFHHQGKPVDQQSRSVNAERFHHSDNGFIQKHVKPPRNYHSNERTARGWTESGQKMLGKPFQNQQLNVKVKESSTPKKDEREKENHAEFQEHVEEVKKNDVVGVEDKAEEQKPVLAPGENPWTSSNVWHRRELAKHGNGKLAEKSGNANSGCRLNPFAEEFVPGPSHGAYSDCDVVHPNQSWNTHYHNEQAVPSSGVVNDAEPPTEQDERVPARPIALPIAFPVSPLPLMIQSPNSPVVVHAFVPTGNGQGFYLPVTLPPLEEYYASLMYNQCPPNFPPPPFDPHMSHGMFPGSPEMIPPPPLNVQFSPPVSGESVSLESVGSELQNHHVVSETSDNVPIPEMSGSMEKNGNFEGISLKGRVQLSSADLSGIWSHKPEEGGYFGGYTPFEPPIDDLSTNSGKEDEESVDEAIRDV